MRYISLLRGINVGGHKKIKMVDLRRLYGDLGFANVKSYVQSGNVVFDSSVTDRAQLIKQIELQIEATYGFHVPVLLRTVDEFQRILVENPYGSADDDNKHQYILFLDRSLTPEEVNGIVIPERITDQFTALGDALAIYYPKGASRAKLTTNFFERKFNIIGTMRNWRTVNKLFAMACAQPPLEAPSYANKIEASSGCR